MSQDASKTLPVSVVIPLLDEAPNVDVLLERTLDAISGLESPQVVLVDDGSTDGTLEKLRDWHARFPSRIHVISLDGNHGQHRAILAGFGASQGRYVVTLDGDLQNPPEEIPRLVSALQAGADFVVGDRVARRDRWSRRIVSALLRRVAPWFTGVPAHDYGCMLRGYDSALVERVLQHGNGASYVPVVAFHWATQVQFIAVEHESRRAGESKYGFLELLALARDLLSSSPQAPMRLAMWTALVLAGCVLHAGSAKGGFSWTAMTGIWGGLLALTGLVSIYVWKQKRISPPGVQVAMELPAVAQAESDAPPEGPRVLVCAFREVGHAVLRFLIESGENVVAVATHPETPDERAAYPSVGDLAAAYDIPVLASGRVRSPQFREELEDLGVNLIVSAYYRRILPRSVLDLATWGAFNLHPALLPSYRGRAPLNWAILRGESETGMTLHEMVEEVDAGPIVAQVAVPIGPMDVVADVSARVAEAGMAMFEEAWTSIRARRYVATPQDETMAFSVPGRGPEDGRIDWQQSSTAVHDLVRAVSSPFPGAFSAFKGAVIKIWAAHPVRGQGPGGPPGQILASEGTEVRVMCGDGNWLVLDEIQWSDGQYLRGPELVAAFSGADGQVLGVKETLT